MVSVRTTHDGLPATLSVLRDMTARQQAEGERERSHALLEATLEATADAILVIDPTGRLIRYNQQLLGLWALPAELAASGDTAAVVRHVAAQLADPAAFIATVAGRSRRPTTNRRTTSSSEWSTPTASSGGAGRPGVWCATPQDGRTGSSA